MAAVDDVPVQIVLRPYASAIPLASFAFGVGNFLYAALLLHWIPQAESRQVGMMLLGFVAPLELGPSVMAFLARDTGGATTYAIFGMAWVVQGLSLLADPAAAPSAAVGVFLFSLALCLLLLAVVTFKGKPLLGAVLVVALVRTAGAALAETTASAWWSKATAVCGLVLGLLAFYSGFAFLEEDVTLKISPLTFRMGEAREAMEGRLTDQLATVGREAGVRKQL